VAWRKPKDEGGEKELLAALGDKIRQLREAANLSQRDFGDLAELTQTYVYQIETGRVNFTVGALGKIASALGVSIAELFSWDDPAPAAIAVLKGLEGELRKLGESLQIRTKREEEVLKVIEARLADHLEISNEILHRQL
jgi:transcriptional regulator with XRE-family HTH domain